MHYKAIFIDIDDTLLDYIPCCKEAFDFAMNEIKYGSSTQMDEWFELFMSIANQLFDEAKKGKYTIAQVMELYPTQFIEQARLPLHTLEPFKNAFREAWGRTNVLIKGAKETLTELKNNHIQLYAASNSFGQLQRNRLQAAGLFDLFDKTYISLDIGYDKPDKRFFEFALHDAKLQPNEVLMVGDSLTTDIFGAQQLGIHTCWFNPNNRTSVNIQPTYEIHSLSQLISLLA